MPALLTAVAALSVIFSADARADMSLDRTLFPKPAVVREQVRFWEKIFQRFPSTTVVIHDAHRIGRLVDLIDFKAVHLEKSGRVMKRAKREEIAELYLSRYKLAVSRLRKYRRSALRFGAIERRVYRVYKKSPKDLRRLYKGKVVLRTQAGLKGDFVTATATARAYFPYMEAAFRKHGVPIALTRLPFVESMFNSRARSKVGASGVWQFMPATAKRYLHVSRFFDERNSIKKSTRAAARLLADNYKTLGSWPLAVTAYNHGASGLRRAVRRLHTRDIGTIIKNYRSKSFGFASRNFYAEFIAAHQVYNRLVRSGDALPPKALVRTRSIRLNVPISVAQLVSKTPMTKASLQRHNSCLNSSLFGRYRHVPLPKSYRIEVPANLAQRTVAALGTIKSKSYARR